MADLLPDCRSILIHKLTITKQILLGWVIAQRRVRCHEVVAQRFDLGQCQVGRHCILGEFVPLRHKKSPPNGGRVFWGQGLVILDFLLCAVDCPHPNRFCDLGGQQ